MSAVCKQPGCIRDASRVGWCVAHYTRQSRGGDMDAPVMVRYANAPDRFWAKVVKTESCWFWNATMGTTGYGQFSFGSKVRSAHRISYTWANGQIPAGVEIDHMCHNRACVNPDHLRPVSSGQNSQNLQGAPSNSTSGVRGVSWHEARGKWRAAARLAGKQHHLGLFATIAEAEAVVIEWRRINMPYSLMDQKKAA